MLYIKKNRESKRSIKQQSRRNDADNQKKKLIVNFTPPLQTSGAKKLEKRENFIILKYGYLVAHDFVIL